ncbi:QVPTGV class sortase B protein-sorting domain-containing protein [Halomicrobium sp. ZPS1]|uniref:DUF3054 domain-containing protein n=3 Tax=Haloarculaceae TaxID=1963268 RepID=C7P097_HALMD|nr:conserved hypothetical protein [Halomicrobium mukohataei DSM 12286]QCD64318.1 DUF3054 domain-containing protein [Halomicrobium mukohataei]QFR19124.1 QVPTGV class sortase B protein-sorting domain-containing protein [Halomicrobium sp. ZPS1]
MELRDAGMSVSSSVGRRVDPELSMVLLALGDVLAVTIFVGIGEITHGVDPIAQPGRVAGTLAPFLIGLAVVTVGGGLYTRDAIRSPGRAVSLIVPAWIVAVVVAQLLRATAVFPGNAAITFAIVSTIVGGVLLLVWRAVASVVL